MTGRCLPIETVADNCNVHLVCVNELHSKPTQKSSKPNVEPAPGHTDLVRKSLVIKDGGQRKAYFGPKQPWLPFENGTRYRFNVEYDCNHRSGWKLKELAKIVASRRTKWFDMLIEV